MDKEDIDLAVATARTSFESWSKSSYNERRNILASASSYLAENAGSYADDIAAENGKTKTDALIADILTVAHLLKYYSSHLHKFLKPENRDPGFILPPGRKCYYRFEPKGIVGVISPWNYPFTLSAAPVTSAIAAGNAVILKPSSQTTKSGLIIKEIFDNAGLPEGVLQVITGTGSLTGQAFIENDGLDMLFFTGSTEVGREVSIRAAERFVPSILELGGKDFAIVTNKADLNRAAHGVAWGGYTNSGQTCIGIEVILVQRGVYEPFMKKLTKLVSGLKLGTGPGEIGAMTMVSQIEIVERQLKDALEKGAKIAAEGSSPPDSVGNWCVPRLLADITTDMEIFQEETFGPVKGVMVFDTIDEAVELANSVKYGLSGAVFTKDMKEGRMIAERIRTGSVNINDVLLTYAVPSIPFGGVKQSGVGRYHGKAGLRAFTDVKSITETRMPNKRDVWWYPMWPHTDLIVENLINVLFSKNYINLAVHSISASILVSWAFFKKAIDFCKNSLH